MQNHTLNATLREQTGKNVATLREKRLIPAVLYGNKVQNQNLTVPRSEFEKTYKAAGASSLVSLVVGEQTPVMVLIQDVQRDPRVNEVQHIDFYQVNMAEKLTAQVQFKFIGESKAVKTLGGILLKNATQVEVRCLPKDLVHEIEVDISGLQTFDDVITIKDITIPAGIEILDDVSNIVVSVTPPVSEEELKRSLEGKPEENVEAVKVEEKGKKEEEEKK